MEKNSSLIIKRLFYSFHERLQHEQFFEFIGQNISSNYRCGFLRLIPLLLRDCKMDLNETLGLYRVGSELMQGHRFNFRSEAQTGKIGSSEKYNMGI